MKNYWRRPARTADKGSLYEDFAQEQRFRHPCGELLSAEKFTNCRRLPAYFTPLTLMDRTWAHRDVLCPYLKTKTDKTFFN